MYFCISSFLDTLHPHSNHSFFNTSIYNPINFVSAPIFIKSFPLTGNTGIFIESSVFKIFFIYSLSLLSKFKNNQTSLQTSFPYLYTALFNDTVSLKLFKDNIIKKDPNKMSFTYFYCDYPDKLMHIRGANSYLVNIPSAFT